RQRAGRRSGVNATPLPRARERSRAARVRVDYPPSASHSSCSDRLPARQHRRAEPSIMNTKSPLTIVKLDDASASEEKLELDPARLVAGSPIPEPAGRNGFTDATGRFFGGIWRSTAGTWRVRYTENELCVM